MPTRTVLFVYLAAGIFALLSIVLVLTISPTATGRAVTDVPAVGNFGLFLVGLLATGLLVFYVARKQEAMQYPKELRRDYKELKKLEKELKKT